MDKTTPERTRMDRADLWLDEVRDELQAAIGKFPPFNSAHEGYAVILEELDELWDEVKMKQSRRDIAAMKTEAKQVAAMALRFLVDVDGRT